MLRLNSRESVGAVGIGLPALCPKDRVRRLAISLPLGTVTLTSMSDVTQMLDAAAAGDPKAAAELLPLVYDELRRLAAAHLAAEADRKPPGHCTCPRGLPPAHRSGTPAQMERPRVCRVKCRSARRHDRRRVSPDGSRIAAETRGGIRPQPIAVWDAATGKELARCPNSTQASLNLNFTGDGKRSGSAGKGPVA